MGDKDLIFITPWVRVSMCTRGYLGVMDVLAMGNIAKAVILMVYLVGISVSISCSFIHLFPGSFYQLAQMWARRGKQ